MLLVIHACFLVTPFDKARENYDYEVDLCFIIESGTQVYINTCCTENESYFCVFLKKGAHNV